MFLSFTSLNYYPNVKRFCIYLCQIPAISGIYLKHLATSPLNLRYIVSGLYYYIPNQGGRGKIYDSKRLHCSALVIKLYQGPEMPYLYPASYYTGAEKIG